MFCLLFSFEILELVRDKILETYGTTNDASCAFLPFFRFFSKTDTTVMNKQCCVFHFRKGYPMVLVGNKTDLPNYERKVTAEEGSDKAVHWGIRQNGFLETSAKDCDVRPSSSSF